MINYKTILLIVITMLFSSCATIFKGNVEKVSFYSEPSDAEVFINGEFAGITPLFDVKLRSNLKENPAYFIEIRKYGFYPYITTINTEIHRGYLILDMITALPTFGITLMEDARTGSWFTLDEEDIKGNLRKLPE